MRQIPKKNYFYLLLLVVITVILTLAFFNVYSNYAAKKESYMSQNVNCINNLDLKSLLIENTILYVYIDDKYDNKDNKVEEELFDELKELDINKDFVFMDNTDKKNQKYILNNFNVDIKNKKLLFVFEDGQLVEKKELKDEIKEEVIKIVSKYEDIND